MSILNKRVSRLKHVPGIGVDRMGNAADAANNSELLRLENLDTDILPPSIAIEITQQSVGQDNNNSYLPFFGQEELRRAVVNHVEAISGVKYNWQSQCIITAGGLSGILNCLLALIEPGDEVIVTDPIYAGLINRIYVSGGIPKFAPLIPTKDGWQFDLAVFKSLISERTRVILMMSPSMPTGHVLTNNEWQAIVDVCKEKNIWLLYDAAMERILYDNKTVINPAAFTGMQDRTIIVGSASKELRMIGWRVGWVVGPESIINDVGLVGLSNVVCPVGIAMAGVAAALQAKDDGLRSAVAVWQRRRDILIHELQDLPIVIPDGGWSMLMNVKQLGFSADKASELLFKQGGIAATPMIGWGNSASDYIRFVFSNEPEQRLLGIGRKVRKALNII